MLKEPLNPSSVTEPAPGELEADGEAFMAAMGQLTGGGPK